MVTDHFKLLLAFKSLKILLETFIFINYKPKDTKHTFNTHHAEQYLSV